MKILFFLPFFEKFNISVVARRSAITVCFSQGAIKMNTKSYNDSSNRIKRVWSGETMQICATNGRDDIREEKSDKRAKIKDI